VIVAEGDPLQGHRAAEAALRPLRLCGLRDVGLLSHHLSDAVQRRGGSLEGVVDQAQLPERAEEAVDIAQERQEHAHRDHPLGRQHPAIAQDEGNAEHVGDRHRGKDGGEEQAGAQVRLHILEAQALELLDREGLAGQRLGHPHPCHALFHACVHRRQRLLHVAVGLPHGLAQQPHGDHHHRNGGQRDDAQGHVHRGHDGDDADERQQVVDQVEDAVGRDLGDCIDIIGDA